MNAPAANDIIESHSSDSPALDSACEHQRWESWLDMTRLLDGQDQPTGLFILKLRLRCLRCKMDFLFEQQELVAFSTDRVEMSVAMKVANDLGVLDCSEDARPS
jgi:hypothetical protein